jgi:hypothetical protein
MAATLVNERGQSLRVSRPVHLYQPIAKKVDVLGMHMSNRDPKHRRMMPNVHVPGEMYRHFGATETTRRLRATASFHPL